MSAKPKKYLCMAEAALALGIAERSVLDLTLSGAKQPLDRGGTVEIEYDLVDGEVVFTAQAVQRFLKQCPLGNLIPISEAAKRLAVHRSEMSVLVYTGIQTTTGAVLRLPVWVIGGAEFVMTSDLEDFAVHFHASQERRAARDHAKKYANRGRKPGKADEAM